jgi:DNA-binding MarR family transcriptional regulator
MAVVSQSPPEPPAATRPELSGEVSPAFFLMALGRRVRSDVEENLRGSGLTLRHVSALGHLAHQPGLSYSELARRVGVSAQSMQATLSQLEQRRAVEKRTPGGRGRTAQLHLTATGESLLVQGRDAISRADGQLLACLTGQQREQLTTLLFELFLSAPRPDLGPQAEPPVGSRTAPAGA